MKRTILLLCFGIALIGSLAPRAIIAQTKDTGLITDCDNVVLLSNGAVDKDRTTRCGVEDFVNQFVVLGQYGITIVVFLAALMLVYGGFEFITAGGRQSKISSGQNIISGTVIGLIISFSAYVIINFAVGAITGTKTSSNPFTAIATVFGGREVDNVSITRPFSGEGDPSPAGCRINWDTTCTNKVMCADPADEQLTGNIAGAQSRLNSLGCGCGTIDGCFGSQTLTCVRRFQIANSLVPNGTIDQDTSDALAENTPVRCDTSTAKAKIDSVLSQLPKPSANVSDTASGETGCCVIQKNFGSTNLVPLSCMDELDARACEALGPDSAYFVPGKRCSEDSQTAEWCGFCQSSTGTCFQSTGQYWCQNIAKESNGSTPLTFNKGTCTGLTTICGGGCDDTLKTTP